MQKNEIENEEDEEEKLSEDGGEQVSQQHLDTSKLTVDEILQLAEESCEQVNVEEAAQYYEDALNREPKNEHLLASYTEFLMNTKDFEQAEEVLQLTLGLYPGTRFYKMFFQLAELKGGRKGIELYLKGI